MALDTALSGGDLTAYQNSVLTNAGYMGTWRLSVFPMTTFATARINQAVFATPLAQLTVDTTSADWSSVRKNMMAFIGTSAGAHDIGIYRVRETPGATTLYIMETSPGDPGLVAKRVTKLFVDNAYVTIIDAPNIWSVFPRITYSGGAGTFLKDYDDAYVSQNSSSGAVPGILRLGEHTIVKVADGATHTESRTASETLFASSVSSRQWTPPSGASLVSGSATAATAGYEYPVGNHLIKYSETLANTAVMSGQRCVIVHDDTTNPALEISDPSWDEGLEGVRCSVNLISDFDTDILAGAMVFLWQDMDSTTIASATNYMVGFVERINGNIEPGLGTASLDIISPLAVMSRVKGFSQELTYAASPANWQETNIAYYDFWAWYILHYHTTILQHFDFTPSGRTTRTASGWRASAGSWLEAVNGTVDADNAQLTADPHGNLYLKRDPFLMTTSERSGLVTRLELTNDYISSIRYTRRIRPTVHKVEAYAFSVGTGEPTAYRSQAIGNTGGQGYEGTRLTDQRCSQSELNARNGNEYARQNNPYDSISVTLVSGYHVINPALRYLVNLTITDATLLPEGSTEPLDFDCVPTQVSISWETDEIGNATPLISLTLIPLTDGNATPGETMPLEARAGAEYTIPEIDPITGFPELNFDPLAPFPDYFGLPPIGGGFGDTALAGTPGTGTPEGEIVAWADDIGHLTDGVSDWTQEATIAGDIILHAWRSDAATPAAMKTWLAARTNGIYYTAHLLTTAPTLKQAGSGYSLIRACLGDGTGATAVAYRPTEYGSWSEAFDFTVDDGGFVTLVKTDLDPDAAPGVYVAATGWRTQVKNTDGGGNQSALWIGLDLGGSETITDFNIAFSNSGTAASCFHQKILRTGGHEGSATYSVSDTTKKGTGAQTWNSSLSAEADYVEIVLVISSTVTSTLTSLTLEGDEWNPFGTVRTMYTGDNFTSATTRDVADYKGDQGFDVSDFSLGNIAAANFGIYYSTSHSGTYAQLSGLTGLDGETNVMLIREPYRKLATQALNNSHTTRQFIYGTRTSVSGATLWGITFNDTSGSIVAQSDMTPIINGTTFAIVGQKALVTYGSNTQRILAIAEPDGGGTRVVIASTNGGSSWTIQQEDIDVELVEFLPEVWGGDGSIALLVGADGIFYTNDLADTITALTGDFAGDVAALSGLRGGFEVGS